MCQRGNCRSAALAYLLKDYAGIDALACGWESNPSALDMLGEWATHIFVMQPEFIEHIDPELRPKVSAQFDVGPDRWGNPMHPELLGLLSSMMKGEGVE